MRARYDNGEDVMNPQKEQNGFNGFNGFPGGFPGFFPGGGNQHFEFHFG